MRHANTTLLLVLLALPAGRITAQSNLNDDRLLIGFMVNYSDVGNSKELRMYVVGAAGSWCGGW